MQKIDSLPYNTFKKLKSKYSVVTIVLRQRDLSFQGLHLAFKDHRSYVYHQFDQIGVEVTRFSHDYNSLDKTEPKLGLVFLANDSVIDPGLEVHALIGHNAKYKEGLIEKSKI